MAVCVCVCSSFPSFLGVCFGTSSPSPLLQCCWSWRWSGQKKKSWICWPHIWDAAEKREDDKKNEQLCFPFLELWGGRWSHIVNDTTLYIVLYIYFLYNKDFPTQKKFLLHAVQCKRVYLVQVFLEERKGKKSFLLLLSETTLENHVYFSKEKKNKKKTDFIFDHGTKEKGK